MSGGEGVRVGSARIEGVRVGEDWGGREEGMGDERERRVGGVSREKG
jgi:hypothetical protein